jgi:hypothetical protein
MKSIKPPWNITGSDFSQAGWHSEPTAAYQMMFEFLRLSPSYELARLERTKGLSNAARRRVPKDFDKVLATYDLIGDVGHVLFRDWWLSKGLKVFGKPYSKPDLHEIAVFAKGQETDILQVTRDVLNYLPNARKSEGLPGTLVLSVPLEIKRTEILKKFRALLDKHLEMNCGDSSKPKITIQGERFHVYAMSKGLRLIWLKAEKPEWELWRLGAKADISSSYSKILDPLAPRKPKNAIEVDDRNILGKITFRSLHRFERIAENAARGKFPCEDDVECLDFDYPNLGKRMHKYQEWIVNQKHLMLKEFITQKREVFAEAWDFIPNKDRPQNKFIPLIKKNS